ncbi:MAG: hypothetical protein KAS90_01475 [Candidatus Aenigmarchaeota archaeon]|nr:hypothetical protein [Candidatus Aenigmarchaeota archaeon]
MDKVDICKGVELCFDASNIYILNEGKRKDLTNKGGKVLNSLYYLFGQYLEEHEISFDFKDNLDMIGISNINVMSKQFMNLHLLENNHDGRVLSDCGNNLVKKIINYISENSGVYDSIKNLRYLGLFDKCQNLIGDGECEDLNLDTKIFDTYPEDTIDPVPVSPVAEMLTDESVVPDSVDDVDPLPVDQTGAEDVVMPDQGETDASAYPLSHEEIKLAIGRDILVWDGDRLAVTDKGKENETFMYIYGNRIEAVNMQAVSDVPEEDLSGTEEDPAETYFKILEKYDIVKRTDGFNGYKIMSGDIDVPLTDTKSNKHGGLSAFATPEIYTLEVIYEAHKNKLYLDENRLDKILQSLLKKAAKYGKNVLGNQSLVLFDENKSIHPGEYTESLISIVSDFFQNGYEDIQKLEGIDFALRRLNSIEEHLNMFYDSWPYKEFVEFNLSDSEPEVAAPVSSDVAVPQKAVKKPEPKKPDFGRYSWRENQSEAGQSQVIKKIPHNREIDEQLDNRVKFNDGIVSDASLGTPVEVVDLNGVISIIYGSGNGNGTSPQRKVIKTGAGLTELGKRYIPGEDISLRDTELVTDLEKGLSELNLFDYSGKLNEFGLQLVEALGIESNVISHLKS